jgi:hypothetical protein
LSCCLRPASVEPAIVRKTSRGDQNATNTVVLDDITPQYSKASCALNACTANLATALQFLMQLRISRRHAIFARGR